MTQFLFFDRYSLNQAKYWCFTLSLPKRSRFSLCLSVYVSVYIRTAYTNITKLEVLLPAEFLTTGKYEKKWLKGVCSRFPSVKHCLWSKIYSLPSNPPSPLQYTLFYLSNRRLVPQKQYYLVRIENLFCITKRSKVRKSPRKAITVDDTNLISNKTSASTKSIFPTLCFQKKSFSNAVKMQKCCYTAFVQRHMRLHIVKIYWNFSNIPCIYSLEPLMYITTTTFHRTSVPWLRES